MQYLINGGSDSQLTPLDRGFAYGDGVFRTFVVERGRPRLWGRHYRKLHDDCHALGIVCPPQKLLISDIERLCGNDDGAIVVKVVITRGESDRGYAVPEQPHPSRVLLKAKLPQYPERNFTAGVKLHLCQLRLAEQPRLAGIKHLNRLENVLARMEWSDTQIADGLLLDHAGHVVECTMSNIFMRTGDLLSTPRLDTCGVAGITRQRILDHAPYLGYRVETATFGLDDLLRADEVIICNSLIGAWQVHSLCDARWAPGALAQQVRNFLQEEDASTVI